VTRGAVFIQVDPLGWDGGQGRSVIGGYRQLPASPASVDDLALKLAPATRAIDIVVRSSITGALGAASVWVMAGHWQIKTLSDLRRTPVFASPEVHPAPVGDTATPASVGKVRRDDLFAHVEHLPDGDLTVCAISLPTGAELSQSQLLAHLDDLVLRCQQIGPGDAAVVLDVPPQRRFD
jgi:hypothetical protein